MKWKRFLFLWVILVLLDLFNYSAGTLLASTGNWNVGAQTSATPGGFNPSFGWRKTACPGVKPDAYGGVPLNFNIATYARNIGHANHSVQITFDVGDYTFVDWPANESKGFPCGTPSFFEVGVILRYDPTSGDYYFAEVVGAGGWFQYPIVGWTTGVLAIGKRVGGVTTILAAQNMGFGSGKLECSVCGQELVARVMGGDLTTPWDYAENLELGYPVLEVSDTDIPSGTFGGMLGEGDGNTDVGGPMFPRITSWIQQADADKTILVVDASGNVYAVDRINAGPGEVFVEMFGALDFDQYATANQGDSALLLGAFSGCATGCTAACTAGCTASCTATCTSGCTASCTTGCEGNCEAACQTACETQACQTSCETQNCQAGCTAGCTFSCTTGCTSGCTAGCEIPCESSGCQGGCTAGCTAACTAGCTASCTAGCTNSCTAACTNSCTSGCTATCAGGCVSGCTTGCTAACTASCTAGCTSECTDSCTAECTADCTAACTASCTTICESACETGCETHTCQTACETQACQTACETQACQTACQTHTCQTACETEACQTACQTHTCQTACETQACQTACQTHTCQTACETQACQTACQTHTCQTACETQACQTACQTHTCQTACETQSCQTACQTHPCQTACETATQIISADYYCCKLQFWGAAGHQPDNTTCSGSPYGTTYSCMQGSSIIGFGSGACHVTVAGQSCNMVTILGPAWSTLAGCQGVPCNAST